MVYSRFQSYARKQMNFEQEIVQLQNTLVVIANSRMFRGNLG
jgi:hypothetical protein